MNRKPDNPGQKGRLRPPTGSFDNRGAHSTHRKRASLSLIALFLLLMSVACSNQELEARAVTFRIQSVTAAGLQLSSTAPWLPYVTAYLLECEEAGACDGAPAVRFEAIGATGAAVRMTSERCLGDLRECHLQFTPEQPVLTTWLRDGVYAFDAFAYAKTDGAYTEFCLVGGAAEFDVGPGRANEVLITLEACGDSRTMQIGDTREVLFSGAHISQGEAFAFSDANLVVTAFNVDDVAEHATLTVEAGSDAASGTHDLIVTYPNGSTATLEAVVTLVKPTLHAVADSGYRLIEGSNIVIPVAELLSNDTSTSTVVPWNFDSVRNQQNVTVDYSSTAETLTVTSINAAGTATWFEYRIRDALGTTATAIVTIEVLMAPGEAIIFNDLEEFNRFKDSGYTPPTFKEIFDSWPRASSGTYFDVPSAATGDAAAWQYDEDTGSIVQPQNTDHPEMILSPPSDALEYYKFEATLKSDDADDDSIGLVIAFVRADGINMALIAHRGNGDYQTPKNGWGITYFVDGSLTYLSDVSVGGITPTSSGGWRNQETRVKVQRNGDLIVASTTPWNNLDDFQGEMKIDLGANTLNDQPVEVDLSVFKGKSQYGYYSHSQPNSTYENVVMEGGVERDLAILLIDGVDSDDDGTVDTWTASEVWRFEEGEWKDLNRTIQEELGYPRVVTSLAPNPSPDGDPVGTRYEISETKVELVKDAE